LILPRRKRLTLVLGGSKLLGTEVFFMVQSVHVPETVVEAVRMIREELIATETMYDRAISSPETFVVSVHRTWGLWIRNNWGLWSGGPLCNELKELGILVPDDMSSYLLRRAIDELRNV
jgi:hypothetical protein